MATKTSNVMARVEPDIKEWAEQIPRDATSREEFDEIMRTGLEQAKADDSILADEAFAGLRQRIGLYDQRDNLTLT